MGLCNWPKCRPTGDSNRLAKPTWAPPRNVWHSSPRPSWSAATDRPTRLFHAFVVGGPASHSTRLQGGRSGPSGTRDGPEAVLWDSSFPHGPRGDKIMLATKP